MAAKDTTSVTTIDDVPNPVEIKKGLDIAVVDHGDNLTGEKVQVTIANGAGELGRQAVFLSINGHGFNVPRGVPCDVPIEVAAILENATMTEYEAGANGATIEREVQRFSYSIKYLRK
ncbi:hypothetical protein [Massilia antarctica]|uniref:hypothetical protein n=1 Tax=Massilia antarctica TaxID=2765360 RepID=UPI0006BC4A58|nr:hypothetical protein [Massilia sp. H27-R4]MCY0916253.1 hypothetical protein [Massilia sp. H27-R4]CUI05491.1 hypothetical protein BN2497_5759 [Janthinobacterium sp. CG23_2]CUU29277.1 hypothetical protein BN3177_5759 [Janthinobacterium sp. CG23_2]